MSHNVRRDLLIMTFPRADSVCAIGPFNNWSTVATPLTKIGEDEWELVVTPDVDREQLGFFVIAHGQHTGQIVH